MSNEKEKEINKICDAAKMLVYEKLTKKSMTDLLKILRENTNDSDKELEEMVNDLQTQIDGLSYLIKVTEKALQKEIDNIELTFEELEELEKEAEKFQVNYEKQES